MIPTRRAALLESKAILGQLDPEASSDPETLGLWGAIHKRLYDMKDLLRQERLDALTAAIWAHEKGFCYNGINLAFLLDCRAADSAARTPSPTESRPGAYASETLKFARGCSQKASGAKLRTKRGGILGTCNAR